MPIARSLLLATIASFSVVGFAPGAASEVIGQTEGETCWSAESLQFPRGEKEIVIRKTVAFLVQEEMLPAHPYWPGGSSGITIGVGWDIGQHTKEQLALAWAKLSPEQIELLQRASRKTGTTALQVLPQVKEIVIPREIAMDVLAATIHQTYYPTASKIFPGFEMLPVEVQVALISVIFNRGVAFGSDPNWSTAKEVDRRWEMRRFREDVRRRDMFAIYTHISTMKRLWETSGPKGLLLRRRDERTLVRPYALQELRWDEKRDELKARGLPPCIAK